MNKNSFLDELRRSLNGLPKEDIEERISFYSEMIDDRIEEGKSEEEAIKEIGSVDDIIRDIAEDVPLKSLVKERVRSRRKFKPWEIIITVLGFPLWFPLLLTALILIGVIYLVLWIVDLCVWITDFSLGAGAVAAIIMFFIGLLSGKFAFEWLAVCFLAAGLAILLFFGSVEFTKICAKITKKSIIGIKSWFIRGGKKNESI